MRHLIALLLLFYTFPIHAETLVVSGTGDSQSLLRALAPLFEQSHPGVTVKVPDSIGSGGGIRAISQGTIDLARTARPLKEKEKQGLIQHPFAVSPVVFVTHPSVLGIENLTTEQILGIFSGNFRNWQLLGGPDNRIYSITREKGDSSRRVLDRNLAGFSAIKPVGKTFYSTPNTVEAITGHRYTIGYLPLSEALHSKVNILALDGVAPSMENLASGSYPLVNTFYIVSKGEPTGIAKKFLDFLYSKEARAIIEQYGNGQLVRAE